MCVSNKARFHRRSKGFLQLGLRLWVRWGWFALCKRFISHNNFGYKSSQKYLCNVTLKDLARDAGFEQADVGAECLSSPFT